jgi:hypothetical protein
MCLPGGAVRCGYVARMRRGLLIAMLVGVGAAGCASSLPYDADTVGQSVAGATGVRSHYGCHDEASALVCEMRGQGLAEYVVERVGERCWRARLRTVWGRAARPETWPQRVNGCIEASDASNGAQRYD